MWESKETSKEYVRLVEQLAITFWGFAFVAPCRIFKLKTDADGVMMQNPC